MPFIETFLDLSETLNQSVALEKNLPLSSISARINADNLDAWSEYLATHHDFIQSAHISPALWGGTLSANEIVSLLGKYAEKGDLALQSLDIDCGKEDDSQTSNQELLSETLAKIFNGQRSLERISLKNFRLSSASLGMLLKSLPTTITGLSMGDFDESNMVLLVTLLESPECQIKDLSIHSLTDPAAILLARSMYNNISVESVSVSKFPYGLSNEFALTLADALRTSNRTLAYLNLHRAPFSEKSGMAFATALKSNRTLISLKLEGCKAGARAYQIVLEALAAQTEPQITDLAFNWTAEVTELQIELLSAYNHYRYWGQKKWRDPFLRAIEKVKNAKEGDEFVYEEEQYEVETDGSSEASADEGSGEDRENAKRWLMMKEYSSPEDAPKPQTLAELEYLKLIIAIKNKPGWTDKLTDHVRMKVLLEKWKDEAKVQGFSPNVIATAFEELCTDARRVTHALDMVYCGYDCGSIPMVSAEIRSRLISQLRVLEDVPESQRDWHPGSDNKVLDLVHPSLFPLCFGKSCGLSPSAACAKLPWESYLGAGKVSSVSWPFKKQRDDIQWAKFQWLPAEFHVDRTYRSTIQSYINNLHPINHAELYETIGTIFGRFVPLFEAVLTDYLHWPYPLQPRVVIKSPDEFYDGGFEAFSEWERAHWEDEDLDPLPVRTPMIPTSAVPRPRALHLSDPDDVLRVNLRDRSLQVIVKLANIHLTPDDPVYPGGVWHVEGMEHEAIVATGIYYYDIENITASRLSFRMAVAAEYVPYFQNDINGLRQMYGIEDYGQANQVWGHIEASEGLCVAFPNVYQHKVEPFELADKTKPGHRKILVFFLVNPNLKVSSTANIPPQQMDWYWREVQEIRNGKRGKSLLQKLPMEVLGLLRRKLEEMPQSERKVFTLDEAREVRKELMAERKYEVDRVSKIIYERTVSFCEH
ncbi:hypothetical protein BJ742DRAFT_822600 [Cladochytrium replicatum]|nr:hypothetical protein BJ742DRAFT_822600 [Cladochytrium replicatum]